MYEALRATGFTADDVERAMSATVCRGGDLYDALDWLCLNLPNGKYNIDRVTIFAQMKKRTLKMKNDCVFDAVSCKRQL